MRSALFLCGVSGEVWATNQHRGVIPGYANRKTIELSSAIPLYPFSLMHFGLLIGIVRPRQLTGRTYHAIRRSFRSASSCKVKQSIIHHGSAVDRTRNIGIIAHIDAVSPCSAYMSLMLKCFRAKLRRQSVCFTIAATLVE